MTRDEERHGIEDAILSCSDSGQTPPAKWLEEFDVETSDIKPTRLHAKRIMARDLDYEAWGIEPLWED